MKTVTLTTKVSHKKNKECHDSILINTVCPPLPLPFSNMEVKKLFNTNSTKNCLSQILYFTLLTIKIKNEFTATISY